MQTLATNCGPATERGNFGPDRTEKEAARCGIREGSLLAPVFKLTSREWASLPNKWLEQACGMTCWFSGRPGVYVAHDDLVLPLNALIAVTQRVERVSLYTSTLDRAWCAL